MLRTWAWALVGLWLVGCNLESHVDDPTLTVTTLVGPAGGTVALEGGGAVVIPPGALTESTSIKVSKRALSDLADLPDNLEAAGTPYAFEPHGLAFLQPITIEVPFNGSATNVRPIKLADESDMTWQTIVGSSASNGQLSIQTVSFSVIVAARPRSGVGVITLPDGAVVPEDAGLGSGGSGGSGGGGTGGVGGGGGGSTTACTGSASDDPNCINESCPDVTPTTGPRAFKGACCFRQSNADRATVAWNNDGFATIELRQNAMRTISQPTSLGNAVIQASLANTYDQEWSNTLIRIEGIPQSGSGPVVVTIGPGRPNCDGTFSFFGDGAAPDHEGRTDANRWSTSARMALWDWSTPEKLTFPSNDQPPGVRWQPFAKDQGLFGFEQPVQDLSFDFAIGGSSGDEVGAQALNCIGGDLASPAVWNATLVQTTFMPIADLETSTIDSLAITQNQCSFIALGYMHPQLCAEASRTEWSELPFGMCDEQRCYVGDENHPRANCGSVDKPCCDPTGTDSQKPACNAFFIESLAVLAGAEITDAPHIDPSHPFATCQL